MNRSLPITLCSFFFLAINPVNAEWLLPEHAFSDTAHASKPEIAADARGNAISVWEDVNDDNNTIILASHFNAETFNWSLPVLVSDQSATADDFPSLAMNHSGSAIVAFRDKSIPSIHANVYKSGSWSGVDAFLDEGTLSRPLVALNSNGVSVVVWISSVNGLQSVAYGNGFKEVKKIDPLVTDINTPLRLFINDEGKAVAFWSEGYDVVKYSVWQNLEWSQTKKATHKADIRSWDAGLDEQGNMILVFDRGGLIYFKRYIDEKWHDSYLLSESHEKGCHHQFPKIAIDPKGTAMVLWKNHKIHTYESTFFDGRDWKRGPTPIPVSAEIDVKNDRHKYAMVIFSSDTGSHHELKSTFFHPLLGWADPQTILVSENPIKNVKVGVSALYHTAFAVWQGDDKTYGSFAPLAIPPIAPDSLTATVKKDRFPTQTDRIHILKWNDTIDPNAVSYRIKQGHNVIFECRARGTHELVLHNRNHKHPETYGIHSVNMLGIEGAPTKMTIR